MKFHFTLHRIFECRNTILKTAILAQKSSSVSFNTITYYQFFRRVARIPSEDALFRFLFFYSHNTVFNLLAVRIKNLKNTQHFWSLFHEIQSRYLVIGR